MSVVCLFGAKVAVGPGGTGKTLVIFMNKTDMYHFLFIPLLSSYKIEDKYKNEECIPLLSIL